MEISYKRSRGASYMILHEDQARPGTGYQRQIFFENEIPGLLPCQAQRLNGEEYFYYNITGFQCIQNLFENRKFDSKDLKGLFQAWNQCMEILGEYLLESDYLLLAPTFIYRNQDSQAYGFVWFPFQISSLQAELRKLTEYLLPRIDHKDKKAVSLGYGIYKESMEVNLSLETLKRQIYLEEASEERISSWNQTETEDRKAELKAEGIEKESEMLEEMCKKQVREKILDDFYKEEDEEGKPYGLLGTLGIIAGIGTAVFLNKHYRLIPLSWLLMLMCLLLAAGGGGCILWFFVLKPKKISREQENSGETGTGYSPPRKPVRREQDGKRAFSILEPEPFTGAKQDVDQEKHYDGNREKYSGNYEKEYGEQYSVSYEEACLGKHPEEFPDKHKEVSQPGAAMTQVLSQESKSCSCLVGIGLNAGKIFPLEKENILVGKWKESVDIWLDAPTVSRIHGKILHQENEDCLVDLNSKNGSTLNGEYLNPEEPYPLKDGDRIAFAREEFLYSGGSL